VLRGAVQRARRRIASSARCWTKCSIMDERQRKAMLKETFDTVSSGYDGGALRFFPQSAQNMVSLLDLRGDEHVLDVACGTGHASLAVARKLPNGHVTGVDFSAGMLDQAGRKAAAQDARNIGFLERDMAALGFATASFDVALCAFGIFFVDDLDAQLAHIASVVKPGGKIMISSFQEEHYFQPLRELMLARLRTHAIAIPPPTWKRVGNEAACRTLFNQAGLTNTRVESRNAGYYLDGAEQWWDVVWNAGFRRLVSQLPEGARDRFKREHLEEVAALATNEGIWLDVGVLYTVGTKPA
jgi:ubiquinone/menaquinone biosynthesis C-methylase UbiE